MSVRAFARVRVYLAEACVLSGKKDGGGGGKLHSRPDPVKYVPDRQRLHEAAPG
jgi:hypothetical protein